MKIIDKFLIKSFIPPLAVAFGIALFVLVLQFLWVYIDDIMGKGLSIFELTELVFYLSMTMVPLALPIGVLISSVMLLGNLAEKYELSSFKSAGVGLLRVCRPLLYAVAGVTIFSIVTSEYIIPWANLKFYARFYDIRKSKPALTLQDGVFNDEFGDYTIRIGKKEKDGHTLKNGVIIYGNKDKNTQLINETVAKHGDMFTTTDKQFIVMNLFDGVQYEESQPSTNTTKQQYPFVRIKFASWQKLFDLTQFDKQKTNENLFTRNQKTQSSRQLIHSLDSLNIQGNGYLTDLGQNIDNYFTCLQAKPPVADTAAKKNPIIIKNIPLTSNPEFIKHRPNPAPTNKDSLYGLSDERLAGTPFAKNHKKFEVIDQPATVSRQQSTAGNARNNVIAPDFKVTPDTSKFINKKLRADFYDYLKNQTEPDARSIQSSASTKARGVLTQIESTQRNVGILEDSKSKFIYELQMKYSLAVVCLVFLFIGAPMGAIVQKGGFGYPILIAIFFFMIFMVSVIYFKNLKEHASIGGVMAAWIPVFIMVPFACILTYRALNDYRVSGNIFAKIRNLNFNFFNLNRLNKAK